MNQHSDETDRCERLANVGRTVEQMDKQIADLRSRMDERFTAVDSRFDSVDERFDTLDGQMNDLDAKIDRETQNLRTDIRC